MSKQEEIVGKGVSEAIGGEMAKQEEVPKKLSRKDFVKGAAVGGAGVAAVSVLASCAPAATPGETAAPCPTCPPAEECPPCPTPAAAGEAGPVTLEVYNPRGAVEVSELFTARLDTLEGKTICEVSNNGWQYERTFPAIREALQKQFPTVTIVPYTEFGNIPNADDVEGMEELVDKVVAAGCHGAIIGNAG